MRGELFMEFRIGACTEYGEACPFCEGKEPFVAPSPRPYPNYNKLPDYKYCDCTTTPRENRSVDDYLPRANIKKWFKEYKISSKEPDKVREFADTYITDYKYVLDYVKHLELKELRKEARKRQEHKAKSTKEQPLVPDDLQEVEEVEEEVEEEEVITGILESSDEEDDCDHQIVLRRSVRATRTTYHTRKFHGDWCQ